MKTLIKTLDIQNASLTVITAGRRLPLAQFTGKIEIIEHQSMTPVLGRMCKGEKKILKHYTRIYRRKSHFYRRNVRLPELRSALENV